MEHFISNRLYLAGPTKCFSCEQDMINRYGLEYAYIGQTTKCFSCEKKLANNLGPNYANFGQPSKLNDFNRVYVIIFLSTVGVMLWLKDKSNEIKKGM